MYDGGSNGNGPVRGSRSREPETIAHATEPSNIVPTTPKNAPNRM